MGSKALNILLVLTVPNVYKSMSGLTGDSVQDIVVGLVLIHKTLAAEGNLLQRKALPVLKSFRELQAAMIADIKPNHPLRLGISVSLIPDYLPGLLDHISDFGHRYPNLAPEILRMENDEVGPALSSGIIDAAVVMDLGGCFPGLERTVLSAHPASAMVSSRHALFKRQQIHMSDLSGEKMYLPGYGPEFSPLFIAAEKAGSEIDFYRHAQLLPGAVPCPGLRRCCPQPFPPGG